jgi:DNA-3-methyladenine glycosylase I
VKLHDDGLVRCHWCSADQIYIDYHDQEWGREIRGNDQLFEKISLEGFQAGLSWLTILKRRENFRTSFEGFQIEKVANYSESKVEQLMQDTGIIRNRKKIESVIHNAQILRESEINLTDLIWSYKPAIDPEDHTRATSDESIELSKELKSLGLSFVGPTTMYAMMQSIGMVNDHDPNCFLKTER